MAESRPPRTPAAISVADIGSVAITWQTLWPRPVGRTGGAQDGLAAGVHRGLNSTEEGGGSIVTVASKASVSAGASGVAYTASKHGVIGLVKSIAYFYGPQGIRSNAVLPGAVATAIGSTAAPRVPWAMERAQLSMATMNPMPADPDAIAATVSWPASDEASNINGATLLDDGGWGSA
ncbi:MAG TPA: SDR family oxidoreductase [Jiangellales bacterium]|nr:SDR family oxidoreductase [Jiangellales bacterium]